MRLIDPSATDFDVVYNQFRWSVPDKLNVAYQVCDRHVRTRLSAHEYPREVEFIDKLPMTTTGKVRRVDLRARER